MNNIFDIRFSFEQKSKEEVIYKFSNKQGGDFNVFSYHWQCFVWAAIIGFLRNERRTLTPPIADKVFSLNTMMNTNGERVAQALICLAIAKAGSLDIMKEATEAINLINEYANGGFYHIMKLMQNGENSFNDLEKVKQEIFSRNQEQNDIVLSVEKNDSVEASSDEYSTQDIPDEKPANEPVSQPKEYTPRKSRRWSLKDEKELIEYYKSGMSIDQLASVFGKDEDAVKERLMQKGFDV